MKDSSKNLEPVNLAVDLLVKLGVLILLLTWCFQIIRPFVNVIFWGMILTVALWPLFNQLSGKLGDRKKLAALFITLVLLAIIIVPSTIFTESMVSGIRDIGKNLEDNTFEIPPPPEDVKTWPLIGNAVFSTWDLASHNLEKLILNYAGPLKNLGGKLLNALMGTGLGILQFLLSVILSGVFLVIGDKGSETMRKLFKRIVGSRGEEFFQASVVTIRNVAKGVIGVAIIQSFLAGVVFLAAGVPYAGLWTLFALILCIIQIGPGLVIIPVIIWLFTVNSVGMAIFWTILLIVVMLSDNILKPIFMGKGAPVPMLVIFLGAIGGFMASGFMGLFLGAIVLSLGYKLFIAYINENAETSVARNL
jgi:predicted PurR-regulated permease PerM